MIAPARPPVSRRRQFQKSQPGVVRRVARKLFADPSLGDRRYPPLAAWRSWLMAAWAVIVVAAYFTAQLGWRP